MMDKQKGGCYERSHQEEIFLYDHGGFSAIALSILVFFLLFRLRASEKFGFFGADLAPFITARLLRIFSPHVNWFEGSSADNFPKMKTMPRCWQLSAADCDGVA